MGREARATARLDASEDADVFDRLGRPVRAGDFVVTNQGQQVLIQITDVRPQLDPGGPKGRIVSGVARFTFFAPPRRPVPDLLLVKPARDGESPEPSSPVVADEVAQVPWFGTRIQSWLRRAAPPLLVALMVGALPACSGPTAPTETCSLVRLNDGIYLRPGFATVTFQYRFSPATTATLTSQRAPDQNQTVTGPQGFANLALGVSGVWDVTLTTAGGCVATANYCNGNCG